MSIGPVLSVDLGAGIVLPHPIMAASGCLGYGREGSGLVDARHLGGIVTRTVTLEPSVGAPPPRLASTPSGLLTAIGLQNPGIESFLDEDLPVLASLGPPVFLSIGGSRIEEFLRIIHAIHEAPGIVALEIYLSSPDSERHGTFASRMDRTIELVGAVSRLTRFPVFAKLPLLGSELIDTAHACIRAGAHGLTLIDGAQGLAIDARARRPALASTYGLVSGPALKPMSLAAVHRVASALPEVPLLGVGGITSGIDAFEFLLAGAWAVQVGTAMLVDPAAPIRIVRELMDELKSQGVSSVDRIRGALRGDDTTEPDRR